MTVGAGALVNTGEVCDMVLVVSRVYIDAIPARREVDARVQASFTVSVGEAVCLVLGRHIGIGVAQACIELTTLVHCCLRGII